MPAGVEGIGALALTGATLWADPAADPLQDAAVFVRGGTIAYVGPRSKMRIPRGTAMLDCTGGTIAAGFWNTHVHFHERKWANVAEVPAPELERQLQDLAGYGFTSVFDLSSPWENTRRLRDRIESGEVAGPRIYSTGEGLIPAGGRPSGDVFRVLGLMDTALPEVAAPEQSREAAGKLWTGAILPRT